MCRDSLRSWAPTASIAARHNTRRPGRRHRPATRAPAARRPCRRSLEEVVAAYGHTFFKLKVGGRGSMPMCSASPRSPRCWTASPRRLSCLRSTANEQYDDLDALLELWRRHASVAAICKRLVASVLFIEQPINRKACARHRRDGAIAGQAGHRRRIRCRAALIPGRPPRSGYTGVSSKCCKGPLQIDPQRRPACKRWNAGERRVSATFMSGEGSPPPRRGLAVQAGFSRAGQSARAHTCGAQRPSLRQRHGSSAGARRAGCLPGRARRFFTRRVVARVRLKISNGCLAIGSLAGRGLRLRRVS